MLLKQTQKFRQEMGNASTCKPIPRHVTTGGSASFKTPTSTVIPVSPSFGVLVYLPPTLPLRLENN